LTSNIKLSESKQIRSVWNEAEQKWYFVVEDIVTVLRGSNDPKQYIKRVRQRDEALVVETPGGKQISKKEK
jgi:DNA-damage-inducible protein D